MADSLLIPVIDGHNDMLGRYVKGKEENYDFLEHTDEGHLDIHRAREGGFAGGFFAVFSPSPPEPDGKVKEHDFSQYKTDDGFAFPPIDPVEQPYSLNMAMREAAQLFRIEAQSDGQFKVVRTADELVACLNDGVMAGIFHMEGAEAIDTDLNALEVLYRAGLRSLGLVWSRPTAFGHGVPFRFPHSPDTGPGLTEAGKELVRACNRLGIMVDVSHLNEKGFWDVAEITDAPIVATHSCVHSICPLTRNLTDKQLDAITKSNGMVGLNFGVMFLREDGGFDTDVPLETMVKHIDYMVERMGIDCVGMGSDFDGTRIPDAIGDVTGLPNLMQALREAGYDDAALRKIGHENWVRVLRATWK